MGRELDELPVDPEEANNLKLHVQNCVQRHAALVRFMHQDRKFTWVYRIVMIPLTLTTLGFMWKLFELFQPLAKLLVVQD